MARNKMDGTKERGHDAEVVKDSKRVWRGRHIKPVTVGMLHIGWTAYMYATQKSKTRNKMANLALTFTLGGFCQSLPCQASRTNTKTALPLMPVKSNDRGCNLLHSILNVLSCGRELDTQVDEAVVGDNGDERSRNWSCGLTRIEEAVVEDDDDKSMVGDGHGCIDVGGQRTSILLSEVNASGNENGKKRTYLMAGVSLIPVTMAASRHSILRSSRPHLWQ
ncbi:hypothetical protein ARMSODRAFT_983560 [Armillaria solidipes]|uniref:Uncharacterized protein n=1 Tax=Armillaria solidipes TaxID=1076256 RepID=A0A2H3AM14_9AGAR|nr:hypothetical protein ARMSODRAFT_983560 [Armillaria solidipes]